jgi:peroxiredoxin
LLLDPAGELCRSFGVGVTNLLVVRLAHRVTIVIGKDGRIRKSLRGVKPRDHAAEVLALL